MAPNMAMLDEPTTFFSAKNAFQGKKEQGGQDTANRQGDNPGNDDPTDDPEIDRADTASQAYANHCADCNVGG